MIRRDVFLLRRVNNLIRRHMMVLEAGRKVWIPCDVKPGPFGDEKFVRVKTDEIDWCGFVPASGLKTPVEEGRTFVYTTVLEVGGGCFTGVMPGESLTTSCVRGSVSRVTSGSL
jgi:hypothetical protein